MKTLFLSICLILAIVTSGLCDCQVMIAGKKAVVSCTTQALPSDMETYASDATDCCAGSTTDWISSMFIAGESTTVCKVCLRLRKSSAESMGYNAVVSIYGDDGSDNPNPADVRGNFESKAMSSLTTDYAWVCWETGTASVTNGTKYHIVIHCDAYDADPILYWAKDATCGSGAYEVWNRSADGSSWVDLTTGTCGMAQLYK